MHFVFRPTLYFFLAFVIPSSLLQASSSESQPTANQMAQAQPMVFQLFIPNATQEGLTGLLLSHMNVDRKMLHKYLTYHPNSTNLASLAQESSDHKKMSLQLKATKYSDKNCKETFISDANRQEAFIIVADKEDSEALVRLFCCTPVRFPWKNDKKLILLLLLGFFCCINSYLPINRLNILLVND